LILVAGLGNPGPRYARTRHNAGFLVAEQLAARQNIRLKVKSHQGLFGVGRISGREVALLLPQTFMNLSGACVGSAYRSLGIDPGDLIVIHDDIDLPFGTLRLKSGGGHGGHNGLRHIIQVLGHGDFVRLRIGVDRPHPGEDAAHYVLRDFSAAERAQLEKVWDRAIEAVLAVIEKGLQQAMNEFNNRTIDIRC